MDLLLGINAVESALQSRRRSVERVFIEKGRAGGRVSRLKDLARRHAVPVEEMDRVRFERLAGGPRSAHQGVAASVAALPYADPDELLESLETAATLLVLDEVEDPRNLGALVRTAAAAGVAGIYIPERRSAGLSPTVARAAAGAVDRVPMARVGNLTTFLKLLKDRGFWTIGLDAAAERSYDRVTYPARWALVVGGEGRGLRRLVGDSCDERVSIPLESGVESLNVSVAAGICLYEALRQRRAAGDKKLFT